jgi:competence protein ComGC
MIAGAGEAVSGVLGFLLVLGLIVLVVLAVLMPYFVYRISIETERTNKLLRQLLKAYGHEPDP